MMSVRIGLLSAVLFIGFPLGAYAGNSVQSSPRPLEAWERAQDYSLAHPVIAFAVYGRTTDATAKENAKKIKDFFAGQNVRSEYFLAMEDRMGSGIEFFIQGVAYGPKALSKALPLIHQVIAHYKEEFRVTP